MRVLTEASGSLVSGYLIKAVREAGHVAIASDVEEWNHGVALADEFVRFPPAPSEDLWDRVEVLLERHSVDVVLPSFDEMLLGWAERRERLHDRGVAVVISPPETVALCQDKWLTYQLFRDIGVPCPPASLEQLYPLIKPRVGRGSVGVEIVDRPVDMQGRMSQAIARGDEYTVDALFDAEGQPMYVVPRKRIGVRDGKSTRGVTVELPQVSEWVGQIASNLRFVGPVNFQCFVDGEEIGFIEINPRIAGGMALGFRATENWVRPIVASIVGEESFSPQPVQWGLRMARYYEECFSG
jgi:carbamoyl-phosphate synthase large subunit